MLSDNIKVLSIPLLLFQSCDISMAHFINLFHYAKIKNSSSLIYRRKNRLFIDCCDISMAHFINLFHYTKIKNSSSLIYRRKNRLFIDCYLRNIDESSRFRNFLDFGTMVCFLTIIFFGDSELKFIWYPDQY